MAGQGLRELKKARTRQLIADVAARLFAERGYEHVTVSAVAREAEVSEQTIYNYFPSKEQLVIRIRAAASIPRRAEAAKALSGRDPQA
jgi:AcrR family transcriptional regulator